MPTQADLIANVRRSPEITTGLISDVNLLIVLNEGALDLAQKGDANIKTALFSSVASASEYILSGASALVTGFLDLYMPTGAITYTQDSVVKMMPNDFEMRSESWLNKRLPGWRESDASDTLQYVYLSFNSAGDLILGTCPKAKTAVTNAFKIWYKSRGTDMDGATDFPWTSSTDNLVHTEPWQKAIAEYAKWQIHEQITKMQRLGEKHRDVYLAMAEELRINQEKVLVGEIEGMRLGAEVEASDQYGGI